MFTLPDNPIIKRYINLVMCRDKIYDNTHRWFYQLIDRNVLEENIFLEDDITQALYLHLLEWRAVFKGTDKTFYFYMKKLIPWFLRDYIKGEYLYKNFLSTYQSQISDNSLNIKMILSNELLLTSYERYIMFLYFIKDYSISKIAITTYQDRKTIRNTIKEIKKVINNG